MITIKILLTASLVCMFLLVLGSAVYHFVDAVQTSQWSALFFVALTHVAALAVVASLGYGLWSED